ncbi:MAG TPA: hypothetical protein VFW49_16305 [Fluviicoccus sp.]|nr:hypothetical protein [Fluviicoccus sp.]
MLRNITEPKEAREVMLSLLPTCGTLAGIAIGLVGAINLRPLGGEATFADDILLLSALGFLVDCYLIFFAMRTTSDIRRHKLARAIDAVFLASLTLVVFSGFLVVYAFM